MPGPASPSSPSGSTLFFIEPTQKFPAGSARPSLKRTSGEPGSAKPKSLRRSVAGHQKISFEASATSIRSGRDVSQIATTGSSKNQDRRLSPPMS